MKKCMRKIKNRKCNKPADFAISDKIYLCEKHFLPIHNESKDINLDAVKKTFHECVDISLPDNHFREKVHSEIDQIKSILELMKIQMIGCKQPKVFLGFLMASVMESIDIKMTEKESEK